MNQSGVCLVGSVVWAGVGWQRARSPAVHRKARRQWRRPVVTSAWRHRLPVTGGGRPWLCRVDREAAWLRWRGVYHCASSCRAQPIWDVALSVHARHRRTARPADQHLQHGAQQGRSVGRSAVKRYNSSWNPSHSYGASLAIWDHILSPATQPTWTQSAITPAAREAGSRLTIPKGWKAELTLVLVGYTQMVYLFALTTC